MSSDDVLVVDNPDSSRYEIIVGGELGGFVTYRLHADNSITFLHTEVDPGHEGEGIGSDLVREALDASRARGLRVKPVCPFVAGYIERHPEYADLVPAPE